MEPPQNRTFYQKKECLPLPLWPSSISEKRTTLAETYGIKATCYWEQLWRTLGI